VSLPLFTGFERLSALTTAKIEKKDIAVQKWAAEKSALDQYKSTTQRLQNLRNTASARKEAVDQARRGYEIARNRYENGLGSQMEVTEAELQVREAEMNYAMSVTDFLNTKADYDLATGMVPMIDETEYDF
jgi:outer membrane protein TolC